MNKKIILHEIEKYRECKNDFNEFMKNNFTEMSIAESGKQYAAYTGRLEAILTMIGYAAGKGVI